MDLYRIVFLLLVYENLSLATELPATLEEAPRKTYFSNSFLDLFSFRQRTRRHAQSDTSEYEDDDYEIPRWVKWAVPPWRVYQNQGFCRCPQRNYDRSGSEYDGSRRGSRYCASVCRNRGTRRRNYNWWFDNRDDYADEILVYRFYNGGYRSSDNIRNRKGYQSRRTGSRDDYAEVVDTAEYEDFTS